MTAIAVFVKTPGLSPVKTRLAKHIGDEAAAAFHLQAARTVAAVIKAAGPCLFPYWAVAEQDAPSAIWSGFPVIWQGPGGLGIRMDRVYRELLGRHGRVLLVGADAPQIAPSMLLDAAAAIRHGGSDFVLNPAHDGGFWLLGGQRPIPSETWSAVPYSHRETCERMTNALGAIGILHIGPVLADVDEISDLKQLLYYLEGMHSRVPEQTDLLRHLQNLRTLRGSLGCSKRCRR